MKRPRTSARGACIRLWRSCWRRFRSMRATVAGRASGSTLPSSMRNSRSLRRARTSRATCCDGLKMGTMTRALLGVALLAAAAAVHAQVEARAAWVRGTVRGQTTAGAYMELTSDRRASLLGAESPAAGSAEIHEMKMEGNVMRMRAVPKLELPPVKTVELRPGGHHMMLVDLKRQLKKGDLVPIRLKVELSDKTIRTIQIGRAHV